MATFRRLVRQLMAVVRPGHVEREMDREVSAHLALIEDGYRAQGMSEEEAHRAARLAFGGVAQAKELHRDARAIRWLNELKQDVRFAVRSLKRTPGFTTVAVLSVAIGISASASIFSVADALLFKPLGVRAPSAVVAVGIDTPGENVGLGAVSYPNYRDLRDRSQSFDGLVAYQLNTFAFATARDVAPDMRMGMFTSSDFFDVLGVPAVVGRMFSRDDGRADGRDAVLVLGHDFWAGAFGADRAVVGRVVWLNGSPLTIIGIAPERFTGMDQYIRPAFYVPSTMKRQLARATDDDAMENRGARAFGMRGRLKSGVSMAQAQSEVSAVWRGLQRDYPEPTRNQTITLRTDLQTRFRESPEDAMLTMMLLALVAIVLAIACANVASLLLGRARQRTQEVAIRLALGVGSGRLLRQLLTESALLAAAGCVVGLGLAHVAIRLLLNIQVPTDLPVVITPQLDRRVLLFGVFAAAGSAVLFGLAPAWRSLRTDLVPALKRATDGRTVRQRTVGRNILVVTQIAMSMVLLIATSTMLAGFRQSLTLDPGFRTDRLLMMTIDTSLTGATPEETHLFYRRLVDGAARVPGVASVAITGAVPLDPSGEGENVVPEGYQFPAGQESAPVSSATVNDQYFGVVRTAIVSGRGFSAEDRASSRPVVVVNEEFARRYWPGQDALGKRLRSASADSAWMEVVGIARTGKYFFIGEPPRPFIYLPFAQRERSRMSLIVESESADPAGLATPLRTLVRDLNPAQPIYNVRPLSTFYEQRALALPRQLLRVITTMGAMGLVLALIGLYALVAFAVSSRTREIGIRMAIGAPRSRVVWMILRQAVALSTAGIVLGTLGSLVVNRLLSAGLFGLGEPSGTSFVIIPVLLIALMLAASYVPARRASLIDPLRAVRED